MNKFNCSTCGETHPLITLLEFPQPSVVSEISSGQVERHLNVITKNIYGIDRKKIVAKVELNLKIVDYEDELDILIWVEVEGTHLTEKIHELLASKGDNVSLDGKLIQEMPFYRNTLNSPVSLTISRDGFDICIKKLFEKYV